MHKQNKNGFTIVELLIVIVVIAILAALTMVAYNGLQVRAVKSALATDLSQTARLVELDKVDRGQYTTSLEGLAESFQTKPNSDIVRQYTSDGATYCLSVVKNKISMHRTNTSNSDQPGVCEGHDSGEPQVTSVAYTQSGSISGTNPNGGKNYPITINYDVQPTDYVFVVMNVDFYTNVNLTAPSGGTMSKVYEKSMGASGYQKTTAFGGGGLSGNASLNLHVCWIYCDMGGGVKAAYLIYVIRGLGAGLNVTATDTPYGAEPAYNSLVTPAAQTLSAGQMAIFTYLYFGNQMPSLGDSSTPAQTWTSDATRTGAGAAGDLSALAAIHVVPTTNTSIQYSVVMPSSGAPRYVGATLFTLKP